MTICIYHVLVGLARVFSLSLSLQHECFSIIVIYFILLQAVEILLKNSPKFRTMSGPLLYKREFVRVGHII